MTKANTLLAAMFKENTGRALCDSGDIYGRNYEKFQNVDMDKLPTAKLYTDGVGEDGWTTKELNLKDIDWSVSTYHYLTSVLELDAICEEFNAAQEEAAKADGSWGDRYFGVYEAAEEFFDNYDFEAVGKVWNTYNGESKLDTVLQGYTLTLNGDTYILLQVHGGCDVRGGYTDALMFKLNQWEETLTTLPTVAATIELPDGTVYEADGYELHLELSDRSKETEWDEVIPVGSQISVNYCG